MSIIMILFEHKKISKIIEGLEFNSLPNINLPKTRASKIILFKHYTTDAPI